MTARTRQPAYFRQAHVPEPLAVQIVKDTIVAILLLAAVVALCALIYAVVPEPVR